MNCLCVRYGFFTGGSLVTLVALWVKQLLQKHLLLGSNPTWRCFSQALARVILSADFTLSLCICGRTYLYRLVESLCKSAKFVWFLGTLSLGILVYPCCL